MGSFLYYSALTVPRTLESLCSVLSSSYLRQPQLNSFLFSERFSLRDHGQSHFTIRQIHTACISAPPVEIEFNPKRKHKIEHNQGQVLRSPDLVAMEYADLNLPDKLSEEVGQVRVRQHVNPLSSSFSVPVQVPDWNEVFRDATLPLMVDIGSGSGRFLLWMARRNVVSHNYLGLEIRNKLVKRANFWAKEMDLHNIHFMFANATLSFQQLVSAYPGPLMTVSLLCPDPHFKKRHHKRRVLQKSLADSIVKSLAPGGQWVAHHGLPNLKKSFRQDLNIQDIVNHWKSDCFVTIFVQSDVLEVAEDMRNKFDAEKETLQHAHCVNARFECDEEGWILTNPMGIRTEREVHAESEGSKIYRRMYYKSTS